MYGGFINIVTETIALSYKARVFQQIFFARQWQIIPHYKIQGRYIQLCQVCYFFRELESCFSIFLKQTCNLCLFKYCINLLEIMKEDFDFKEESSNDLFYLMLCIEGILHVVRV